MKIFKIIFLITAVVLIIDLVYEWNLSPSAVGTHTDEANIIKSDMEENLEINSVTEKQDVPKPEPRALPTFNTETLTQYNGTDSTLPIYIAFDGLVYDVTPGRKYYEQGGSYDFLSGTDGTKLLKVFGGDLIKKKYTVIGTFTP